MKLLAILAAALLGALALLAGPALSTERWRPDPVDFELAAPAGGAHASSSGRVTSAALRAPKRFNLVGMRWHGRVEPKLSVRVREQGRPWSHWQALDAHGDHNPDPRTGEPEVTASDPLWVGEADQVQYRMDRRVSELRLHFVNVEGTATAGDRLRSAIRGAVNTATASVASVLGGGGGATAQAQDPQPAMVTRAQWGASSCPPRAAPEYGEVKAAYVHHTVSLNDYSPQEAPAIVLAICRYHRNSNGWNDIGYNALVDKYGTLYEGRAGGLENSVVGAQAEGYNTQTTGIASIGNNSEQAAPPEELAAIARFIRWKLPLHGAPTSGTTTLTSGGGSTNRYRSGALVTVPRVLGHRDTGATECPGTILYAQLDDLRALVGSVAPLTGAGTMLTAGADRTSLTYGTEVRLTGFLAKADGTGAASQPVELQTMSDGAWKTARQVTTGADGSFATELKPRKRMYVRARFASGPELRGSSSSKLLLRLRPTVTLHRPASRGRRGRKVPVSGVVTPSKRTVYLVLEQRVRGVWKRVGVRGVRAKKGRFSGTFTPAYRARYRYSIVVRPDLDTDRGSSEERVLRVTR